MQGLRQNCEHSNPPFHTTIEGVNLEVLAR
jgi:hypothetical protein